MKRVKLKQSKSLALFQTLTDSGQTIGFEIRRLKRYTLLASFRYDSATNAHQAYQAMLSALKLMGPRTPNRLLRQLLTGRAFARHTS